MESVSSGRGLCKHIPYICFYISSYFRLAMPLLCKRPIKISSWKRWDPYLCTSSKAAHLECKMPPAPRDQQHLLQPQDKPLIPGMAAVPVRRLLSPHVLSLLPSCSWPCFPQPQGCRDAGRIPVCLEPCALTGQGTKLPMGRQGCVA